MHARIGHLPAREVSPGDIVDIGELTRAEWKRVNFERKEWTIPPEHSKNKKQFVIPLTEQVTGWFIDLRRLAFDSRFVLPLRQRHRGREDDAPMEATSLNAALNRLHDKLGDRCRRFTPHAFVQRHAVTWVPWVSMR